MRYRRHIRRNQKERHPEISAQLVRLGQLKGEPRIVTVRAHLNPRKTIESQLIALCKQAVDNCKVGRLRLRSWAVRKA